MSDRTICDICKKEINIKNKIMLSKTIEFTIFYKFIHYDFCSKKCFLEFIDNKIRG